MRPAAFVVGLALVILAATLAADAQQQAKVAKIGFLALSDPTTTAPYLEAFREGLRELGYVEGQNIVFEPRWARQQANLLPALAAELVRLRVGVIFVGSTPTLQAARQATDAIPIVMAGFADPVGEGFVASLARPGGNITGLSWGDPEVAGKRLELLKEAVPKLSRVAVLFDPRDSSAAPDLGVLRRAAQTIGIGLETFEVRNADEFKTAFTAIKKARADGLVVLDGPLMTTRREQIADLATTNRLPSISENRAYAGAGGLMTYGPRVFDLYRRAGTYVAKILKGAKPADLPVEMPTRFELVFNLKTAKALGLTIPQSVLVRADEVIK